MKSKIFKKYYHPIYIVFSVLFLLIIIFFTHTYQQILSSRAAGSPVQAEAENGTVNPGATIITDAQASGQQAVQFSAAVITPIFPSGNPSVSPQPTTGNILPAQIFNLTNWKLTIPSGPAKNATEIKQPQLATYINDPWFIAASGGIRLRAPVNGVTTSGSNYPRSELREMTNNGMTEANWNSSTGIHTLFLDEAITAVPATKKEIVAGQIHDGTSDVIVVRLDFPKLYINMNGATGPTIDPNYTLGKRFTVKFEVTGDKTNVYYNGSALPVFTYNKSFSNAYFKTGAYTQSNCTKEPANLCNESNYGEVIVYQAIVSHQ